MKPRVVIPLNYIQSVAVLKFIRVILIISTVPKEVYKQEGLEGDNSCTRQDMGHKVRPSCWLSRSTVGWEWERSVFLGAKDSSCTVYLSISISIYVFMTFLTINYEE